MNISTFACQFAKYLHKVACCVRLRSNWLLGCGSRISHTGRQPLIFGQDFFSKNSMKMTETEPREWRTSLASPYIRQSGYRKLSFRIKYQKSNKILKFQICKPLWSILWINLWHQRTILSHKRFKMLDCKTIRAIMIFDHCLHITQTHMILLM